MVLQPTHELHQRRLGRNVGVGLTLVAFVAIVFALTIVKVQRGDDMQGYDHVARPSRSAPAETEAAPASIGTTAPAVQPEAVQ